MHETSADPKIAPHIKFNYMSHEDDWAQFRQCIRLSREIINMPAMASFKGREIQPSEIILSDEQIDSFIRQNLESAYHPCGTLCMEQANDPMAVVDSGM